MTHTQPARGRRGGRAAGHRVGRRLLAAVLAVLTGALGALVLYETSLQPGAALVASVFDQNPLVTPPSGFGQVARAVTRQRVAVPAPDAPTAHLDIYTPDGTSREPRPVILWVHGGGFIGSTAASVADYAILLAHAGYTVAALDYSLAPGARYPAPIRQGNAALRYLRPPGPRVPVQLRPAAGPHRLPAHPGVPGHDDHKPWRLSRC
jgi:acetyl esterase